MGTQHDQRPTPIFREAAIAHRASRQGPGDLIRLSPGWMNWAFYLVVGLFLIALVAASLVHIDRYAEGVAVADDSGRLVVLIPSTVTSDISPGRTVEHAGRTARVVEADNRILYPPEIEQRYGVDLAVPSLAVVTAAPAERAGGRARVLIASEPIIVSLVPGLSALFGGDDA